jgi:dTMP kinase
LQPDLTLWFDLDPAVAAARLAGARVPDKFESQPTDFFAAVGAGYAQRAASQPQRFVRIDAAPLPAQVWEQVRQALVERGLLKAAV